MKAGTLLTITIGLAILTPRSVWAQERWQDEIDAGLVDALLETANDWASDMDEPAMTAEQFLSRLRLETVSFDERGEFTFWFNDGDVFAGHVVNASGTSTGRLTHDGEEQPHQADR